MSAFGAFGAFGAVPETTRPLETTFGHSDSAPRPLETRNTPLRTASNHFWPFKLGSRPQIGPSDSACRQLKTCKTPLKIARTTAGPSDPAARPLRIVQRAQRGARDHKALSCEIMLGSSELTTVATLQNHQAHFSIPQNDSACRENGGEQRSPYKHQSIP